MKQPNLAAPLSANKSVADLNKIKWQQRKWVDTFAFYRKPESIFKETKLGNDKWEIFKVIVQIQQGRQQRHLFPLAAAGPTSDNDPRNFKLAAIFLSFCLTLKVENTFFFSLNYPRDVHALHTHTDWRRWISLFFCFKIILKRERFFKIAGHVLLWKKKSLHQSHDFLSLSLSHSTTLVRYCKFVTRQFLTKTKDRRNSFLANYYCQHTFVVE